MEDYVDDSLFEIALLAGKRSHDSSARVEKEQQVEAENDSVCSLFGLGDFFDDGFGGGGLILERDGREVQFCVEVARECHVCNTRQLNQSLLHDGQPYESLEIIFDRVDRLDEGDTRC